MTGPLLRPIVRLMIGLAGLGAGLAQAAAPVPTGETAILPGLVAVRAIMRAGDKVPAGRHPARPRSSYGSGTLGMVDVSE